MGDMTSAFPTEFARSLPKAELHVHLEGSVGPATMLRLAERHGVTPPAVDEDGISEWLQFDGFPSFLERYFWVCSLLRTADDFTDIAYSYLQNAHEQGVVHVEFHVSSSYHIVESGADWAQVLAGVVAGCERAESDFGISSLLIPDLSPHLGAAAAHQALDVVLALLHPRVVAIGMGGPADNWPTEDFQSAFVRAREAGLHTISHAGEHGPAWEVRHALEEFGAERIQHGIGAMQDPDVVQMLVDQGVACDVCPGSNVALAAIESMDDHPLAAMLDAGITVTLGSDDPPLFGTTLLAEYEHAWNLADLDEDGLRQLAINSLVESFASTEAIEAWLAL
ncbi:MAG: aminodeoxyfutalosine deaminase [Candidatus Aldehydirespiratoraceae bacterium]|jgi:aminodeoxyfutalosine deaminase